MADSSSSQWPQHQRSGAWLIDENGRRSLSWYCAGGVFNLGFSAADVAREVADVIMSHDMGLWTMPSERRRDGEVTFGRLLPPSLDRTFFSPAASESFEVACKLAKRFTRRHTLISMTGGYYGNVGFSMAMDAPILRPEIYEPLAGPIPKAEFGSIESLAALMDDDTAAVCIEALQVPSGVNEAPDGYLRKVRELCDANGALLILDEVQGGMLRTGDQWAFERHGVVPDLLISGKSLGGGHYPIGAMSGRDELFSVFDRLPPLHRSSGSGNEIAAEIAGRIAQRYLEPALISHVDTVGPQLRAGLSELVDANSDVLHGLRGRGLVYGVDVTRPELLRPFVAACAAEGLIVNPVANPTTVTMMPPLITTAREVDEGLSRFGSAVDAVRNVAV